VQSSSTVILDGKEYEVSRSKLRQWLQLEDLREEITRATGSENREQFVATIYSYLSVALSVDIDFSVLPWFEVTNAYITIGNINYPHLDFPMLNSAGSEEKVPWNYEGRSWYAWSHILSSAYSWTLEYVAELDVDDAIGLIQEINTDDQLKKEWEWMLSDRSISYDKQGKGKLHKLDRPDWMDDSIVFDRITTPSHIKKSMLPMGNVLSWSDEPADA
jgi:hypothetical protein